MNRSFLRQTAAVLACILLVVSCQKEEPAADQTLSVDEALLSKNKKQSDALATVSVFATGLNNPRGLAFGPNGNLYVAEGGTGGTESTVEQCPDIQVAPDVGPYLGSPTSGRISVISPTGQRTTLTDQLPSSQTSDAVGGFVSGVADVAFVGDQLYALLAGAGCSHGVASVPNAVLRVNANGSWAIVANLSEWLLDHPTSQPSADFEPEGTWYSLENVRGDLYTVEPNQGKLVKVTTSGAIEQVVDIQGRLGHIVPTALAYHGNFYVGNLNPFPIVQGSSAVYKVTPSGQIKEWITGLTTVLGLAFDSQNRLYVLENTTNNPFPTPGTGRILRVGRSGEVEVIASGLNLPTAMTFGPDGNLYVSNWGFSPAAIGGGQVLKVELHD